MRVLSDDRVAVVFVAPVCEGIAELAVGVAVGVVLPGRDPVLVSTQGTIRTIKTFQGENSLGSGATVRPASTPKSQYASKTAIALDTCCGAELFRHCEETPLDITELM